MKFVSPEKRCAMCEPMTRGGFFIACLGLFLRPWRWLSAENRAVVVPRYLRQPDAVVVTQELLEDTPVALEVEVLDVVRATRRVDNESFPGTFIVPPNFRQLLYEDLKGWNRRS